MVKTFIFDNEHPVKKIPTTVLNYALNNHVLSLVSKIKQKTIVFDQTRS